MEESERFNEWIEQGAAIYICGDEKCMAKDVHQAIKDVLVKERHISRRSRVIIATNETTTTLST